MRRGPVLEISTAAASVSTADSESGAASHEDAAASGDFETWLGEYLSAYRTDAGIADVQLFRNFTEQATLYVAQLSFDSNEALDEFMVGRLASLENDIDEAAPGPIEHHARVLREDDRQTTAAGTSCLNCDSTLRGQYCAHCGQRSQSRLISLWELISDAFGDLFELDSRLWKTLVPLLIRPGLLTADYLQGKRARFMPPFRSYLVLSLLFFVVAFFDPREDLAILFAEEPVSELSSETETSEATADEGSDFKVMIDGEAVEDGNCEIDDEDMDDLPGWLRTRLTKKRLVHICEQATLDDGRQLFDKLLDNIPAALIVLLPLMAFALKALYPLSRRYYVEHLLFFVHFHAFFFLILTLQILWARTISAVGLNEAIGVIPIVASSLYIPVYLFKSMRRVYGQGFFVTLLKYVVLLAGYSIGFGMTLLGAFALAAFSI